jgi:hypothetical protein
MTCSSRSASACPGLGGICSNKNHCPRTSDRPGVQVDKGRGCNPTELRAKNETICDQAFDIGNVQMALIAAPLLTSAHVLGDETPSPPASGSKKDKSTSIDDGKFIAGYGLHHGPRPQRLPVRHRIVEGARPRRQRRRPQSDRLLLSQARRLQGLADLVRARAEGRPRTRPGSITVCGRSNRATAIRRNIT